MSGIALDEISSNPRSFSCCHHFWKKFFGAEDRDFRKFQFRELWTSYTHADTPEIKRSGGRTFVWKVAPGGATKRLRFGTFSGPGLLFDLKLGSSGRFSLSFPEHFRADSQISKNITCKTVRYVKKTPTKLLALQRQLGRGAPMNPTALETDTIVSAVKI